MIFMMSLRTSPEWGIAVTATLGQSHSRTLKTTENRPHNCFRVIYEQVNEI